MVKPLSFAIPKDFKREEKMVKKRKKTLFFPAMNKRLARIISIRSPAAFRKSIRVLAKNGLTVTEKRALVLAQNRARAILRRVDLSVKERKQFRQISKIKIPNTKSRFTSVNNGHRHKWNPKKRFTSFNAGHSHRINVRLRLALLADGHTHRLLKR